jgi:hypothetical protein
LRGSPSAASGRSRRAAHLPSPRACDGLALRRMTSLFLAASCNVALTMLITASVRCLVGRIYAFSGRGLRIGKCGCTLQFGSYNFRHRNLLASQWPPRSPHGRHKWHSCLLVSMIYQFIASAYGACATAVAPLL